MNDTILRIYHEGTKDTKGSILFMKNFVNFVVQCLRIFAACENFLALRFQDGE